MAKRIKSTRSPIEARLHEALLLCRPADAVLVDDTRVAGMTFTLEGGPRHPDEWDYDVRSVLGNDRDQSQLVYLHADVSALTYRLDFLVYRHRFHCRPAWVAVECDGHDWHERTKQQAAYDRARDRELLGVGITTLRFTGSEIFHSADRCASEIYNLVGRLGQRVENASFDAKTSTQIARSNSGGEEHW